MHWCNVTVVVGRINVPVNSVLGTHDDAPTVVGHAYMIKSIGRKWERLSWKEWKMQP